MKAPIFWNKRSLISYLVLPLSFVYIAATIFRNLVTRPIKINKPIICIGNLTVGGAGKTPIAIAIGKILNDSGVQFSYLGHGYNAKIENMVLVDGNKHSSSEVGDEAILLSEVSNTFIARNRVFAAKQIAKMPDEQLIVMDDGLQNPCLKKDLSILVVDGGYGFGNNLIFPAGPLRQRVESGVVNSDLVIVIDDNKNIDYKNIFKSKRVIFAHTKITNKNKLPKKAIIAFCGIARPSKFFNSLNECGVDVIKEISFSDHYSFSEQDLIKLIELANQNNASLVTTKKDWVRLSEEYRSKIKYLDIEIQFPSEDKRYITDKLQSLVNER